MNSFWTGVANVKVPAGDVSNELVQTRQKSRCADLVHFLAIALNDKRNRQVGLHPVVINALPEFSNVSMGGVSFDVRKAKVSSFQGRLDDTAFGKKAHVAVKQPRLSPEGRLESHTLEEIATELQILQHIRLKRHRNILDMVGIVYHDANIDLETPLIIPALVEEYAELGNLGSFFAQGSRRTLQDRFHACRDVAHGLRHLHSCGIVHCDVKDSNILVCLDDEGKVVCKLSDFGFAISRWEKNPQVLGYTQLWAAPEISDKLQPASLCQLDIYSYGLLMYTILRKGPLFYEVGEEEERAATVRKLKITNVMPAIMQTNLLLHMKQERCMLLIYCKILNYCLQVDTERRFPSMDAVLALLDFCDPSDMHWDDHSDEPLYQIKSMPVRYYEDTKTRVHSLFHSALQACITAQDEAPLGAVLRGLFQKRFEIEMEMLLEKPVNFDTDTYRCCPGMHLLLFRSMIGLYNTKTPSSESEEASGSGESQWMRLIYEIEPDFPQYHRVLIKLDHSVMRHLFNELHRIYTEGEDDARRAAAAFNLAYSYIQGLGVASNLSKGVSLLHLAADLGSINARKYVIRICSRQRKLVGLDREKFLSWTNELVEDNDWQCLQLLRSLDSKAFVKRQEERNTALVLQSEGFHSLIDVGSLHYHVSICESSSCFKKLLHFASATGSMEFSQHMLALDKSAIDSPNMYGQTALIVACQSAQLDVATHLLEEGADADAADIHGFTALHWLITFSEEEKSILGAHFEGKLRNINPSGFAPGEIMNDPPPNLRGAPANTSTPLHWAVSAHDLVAVDILLSMGADASGRNGGELSPLELACALRAGAILERLLLNPTTKEKAREYHPFYHSFFHKQLQVNALFWVVAGSSCFASLSDAGTDFQQDIEKAMHCLKDAGVSFDAVAQYPQPNDVFTMSAPFATAFHQCDAQTMQAGLNVGFKPSVDSTCGLVAARSPAMLYAISHGDREMFRMLLDAGASIAWRSSMNLSALCTVAKKTDDVWFAQCLLDRNVLVDDPKDTVSPFFIATYKGHLRVARLLWEQGAIRERRDEDGFTVLGRLVQMKTNNALRCIRFILSLPDRDESDGFEVFRSTTNDAHKASALHLGSVNVIEPGNLWEDPEAIESSRATLFLLLQKYHSSHHINSHMLSHGDVPLGAAIVTGNHYAVRMLLEAGADPNAKDGFSSRPLDKLYWRYYCPTATEYLKTVSPDNTQELTEKLRQVNENTSEMLSLLQTYDAKPNKAQYAIWHQSSPGYRDAEWVAARLRKRRDDFPRGSSGDLDESEQGVLLPERPAQLELLRVPEKQEDEGNNLGAAE